MDVDMFVVVITPSVWTIAANRSVSSTGVLSHSDVLRAEQGNQGINILDQYYGGTNFLSKIPWSKIGSFVKDYALPLASLGATAAPLLLALGDNDKEYKEQKAGLALTGGKPMTSRMIRKRLTQT
jgi:hypothetical protein